MASAASAQTDVPNVFEAGQPARAAEVNENFDTLETAIDQNVADIQQIAGLAGLSPEAAQIQTGLDLTSGLRWLFSDFYVKRGIFPVDNLSVGAGSGTDWSNRFVASANINAGRIQIYFRVDAAPQIANQVVYLTPVDPGSAILWFECSGDGVTDAFVSELACAFSDGPYRPLYDIWQQIQDYFNTNGTWPMDNQQAGLAVPSSYQNNYVTELVVSEFGVITIRFGNKANAAIAGKTMRWRPIFTDAVIWWKCDTVEIENRYMPDECRS